MLKKYSFPLICTLVVLLTNCVTNNSSPDVNWPAKMNLLSVSLGRLVPLSNDAEEFSNPKNEMLIKDELKKIYGLAHDLEDSTKTPDGDPMLKFSSSKFAKDMKFAYQQFSLGNKKQALFDVKNMTNYCISCHSRAEFGRSDFKKSWDFNFNNFSVYERAQFHYATRQYTEGLSLTIQSFEKFISDKSTNTEMGLLNSLAVSVRVKNDPHITEQIVENILKSKVPSYLNKRAHYWKKSIQNWKKEKATIERDRNDLYQKARELVLTGMKNKDPKDSLIEYLRASNLLHKVLMDSKKDIINADSLYLAGMAARPLKEINLWTLHEVYFEKCINSWPQSELAEKCYKELEKEWLGDQYLVGGAPSQAIKDKLITLKDVAVPLRKDEVLNNINYNPINK